jgi:hypothetical protein
MELILFRHGAACPETLIIQRLGWMIGLEINSRWSHFASISDEIFGELPYVIFESSVISKNNFPRFITETTTINNHLEGKTPDSCKWVTH